MIYPTTPKIRVLREKKIDFEPHVFDYACGLLNDHLVSCFRYDKV